MEFPKRTSEHVTETASWKILEAKVPDTWLVRQISERDYGIDAYIELVTTKGEVTGELCSLQVKGSEHIEWQTDETDQPKRATFSIEMPTINYWMRLPVPVFLVWADMSEQRAFFAPVKNQVRNQYDKYRKQQSLSFEFLPDFELGTQLGLTAFVALYVREKNYTRFHSTFREVLIHCNEYLDFMREHQFRDCHLGMESSDELMVQHIHKTCDFLAQMLGVEFDVMTLSDMYKMDRKAFGNEYYHLHEYSVDQLFKTLPRVYVEIIKKCCDRVLGSEAEFWFNTDRLLYRHCEEMNVEYLESRADTA